MSVSVGTLMLAIKTINFEMKRYEEKLRTENLDDEDSDTYGEYVLDLNKALSELSSLYEAERRQLTSVELPPVERLLETP